MARVLKNAYEDYAFTGKGDLGGCVKFIKGGRRAYLHVEGKTNEGRYTFTTFSGPKFLRSLAKAILKEVPHAEK